MNGLNRNGMNVQEARNRLKNLNLLEKCQQSLKENEKILIGFNVGQLYNKGEGIDERKLKHSKKSYSVYSPGYTKKKKAAGKYQGFIDLSFLGDYYKGWKIVINKNKFSLQAGDVIKNGFNLTAGFREWYGKFEGLQPGNFEDFKENYFLPTLKKLIEN
jgi:hypothetical protein